MRFDADINQRRESGCDEDVENNGHLTTLKLVYPNDKADKEENDKQVQRGREKSSIS